MTHGNDASPNDSILQVEYLANDPLRIEYYQNTEKLSAYSPEEVRILLAFRFGVIAGQKGLNTTQILAGRLGSMIVAAHLHRLMSVLNTAWEGQFIIAPPCSDTITADEAIMCQMMRCAMRGQRDAFEDIVGPLFERKALPQIWRLFSNFAQAMLAQA